VTQPARTCPRCGRRYRPEPDHRWRPFCSERCQLIDLGGWLGERHAIAGEPVAPTAERPEEGS